MIIIGLLILCFESMQPVVLYSRADVQIFRFMPFQAVFSIKFGAKYLLVTVDVFTIDKVQDRQ